jgi:SAM-dependent methyltransferase
VRNVHRAAVAGFTAGAEKYARGRPEYPQEIDEWLRSELQLGKGRTALDLGAGTGKFSTHLLKTQADVVAVEPVEAMREQLLQRHPGIAARAGSAEQIPMEAASVDAVVCAQAFHWFATSAALTEILRVLKPGGRLGLVWNARDESVPWVAAITRIIEPFEADTPRFQSQQWRSIFPFPGFGQLRERRFRNRHCGPPEQVVIDRILSISFISALPPDVQKRVENDLRALIAGTPELAGKEMVSFPYETVAYCCTKLA